MEDNTKKYIISKYAFIKKYDNYYLLYHSLYIKKLIGDKTLFRIYNLFKEPKNINSSEFNKEERKTIIKLLENKFLINEYESSYDQYLRKQLSSK